MVQNATPQTIVEFHDELSNQLPTLKGSWSFAFKVFRNNIHSVPPELAASAATSPQNMYLHTWTPSYLHDLCVTLVDKKSAAIFSHVIQEELSSAKDLAISDKHLHEGATTGNNDPFDIMINHRMQSMWTQRQAIRGGGGQIYELENGNLIVRTANVILHGNFRGFLIHIEVDDTKTSFGDDLFPALIAKYGIPHGKLCSDVLDEHNLDLHADLVLQYAEILNF